MIEILKKYSILLACLTFSLSAYSQSFSDFSNVNFSELNDSQIDLLLKKSHCPRL